MSNYLGFEPTDSPVYWFVSYNNEDAERVSDLACAINDAGIPLWYDYGIEYGEKWAWQINEKIAGAQGMILLLTAGILQKDNSYVQKEYKIASEAGTKIIVLLIDEIGKEDVPVRKLDWWVDIRDKQCLEIYRLVSREKQLAEIRRALNPPAGNETVKAPARQETAPERPDLKRKRLLPVILLCAAVLIAAGVWLALNAGGKPADSYDVPDALEYLKGDFRIVGAGEQEEDERHSALVYYDYADEKNPEADVSDLLSLFEGDEWPFRRIDTKEYDQLNTDGSVYRKYSYLYTGTKEISPVQFDKTGDDVKSHMQILVGRLYGTQRTLVELTLVPGLVYGGAEQWKPEDRGT